MDKGEKSLLLLWSEKLQRIKVFFIQPMTLSKSIAENILIHTLSWHGLKYRRQSVIISGVDALMVGQLAVTQWLRQVGSIPTHSTKIARVMKWYT